MSAHTFWPRQAAETANKPKPNPTTIHQTIDSRHSTCRRLNHCLPDPTNNDRTCIYCGRRLMKDTTNK